MLLDARTFPESLDPVPSGTGDVIVFNQHVAQREAGGADPTDPTIMEGIAPHNVMPMPAVIHAHGMAAAEVQPVGIHLSNGAIVNEPVRAVSKPAKMRSRY